jgi:response regulator RpfG family c-di-GMP phosphodiesterase
MRADTRTSFIQATPTKVVEFLANPQNLPRWAVGFAKSIRRENQRWLVTTGAGDMEIRIEADVLSGVVDYFMAPAPGVEMVARSRVVSNGSGAEYLFTQFQPPGMADEAFEKNVRALQHELTVLRALLEVECAL